MGDDIDKASAGLVSANPAKTAFEKLTEHVLKEWGSSTGVSSDPLPKGFLKELKFGSVYGMQAASEIKKKALSFASQANVSDAALKSMMARGSWFQKGMQNLIDEGYLPIDDVGSGKPSSQPVTPDSVHQQALLTHAYIKETYHDQEDKLIVAYNSFHNAMEVQALDGSVIVMLKDGKPWPGEPPAEPEAAPIPPDMMPITAFKKVHDGSKLCGGQSFFVAPDDLTVSEPNVAGPTLLDPATLGSFLDPGDEPDVYGYFRAEDYLDVIRFERRRVWRWDERRVLTSPSWLWTEDMLFAAMYGLARHYMLGGDISYITLEWLQGASVLLNLDSMDELNADAVTMVLTLLERELRAVFELFSASLDGVIAKDQPQLVAARSYLVTGYIPSKIVGDTILWAKEREQHGGVPDFGMHDGPIIS